MSELDFHDVLEGDSSSMAEKLSSYTPHFVIAQEALMFV